MKNIILLPFLFLCFQLPCKFARFKFYKNGEIVKLNLINTSFFGIDSNGNKTSKMLTDSTSRYYLTYTSISNNVIGFRTNGYGRLIQVVHDLDTMKIKFVNPICFRSYNFDSIPFSNNSFVIDGSRIINKETGEIYSYPKEETEQWLILE